MLKKNYYIINLLLDNVYLLNLISFSLFLFLSLFNKINIRLTKFFNLKLNHIINKQKIDNNKSVEKKHVTILYIKM